jgi:large subunit ribosomal protein L18
MSSYKHFDPKVAKKRTKSRFKSGSVRHEVYVLKTNKHLVAVIYDKESKRDLTSISTRPADFKHGENRTEDAKQIGKMVAEKCKTLGIEKVAFNKLSYKFHGLLKAIVDNIRENGINI